MITAKEVVAEQTAKFEAAGRKVTKTLILTNIIEISYESKGVNYIAKIRRSSTWGSYFIRVKVVDSQ